MWFIWLRQKRGAYLKNHAATTNKTDLLFRLSLVFYLTAGAEPELKFMCQNLNNKTNILITFYERQQQKLMEFHNYYLQRI